MTLDVPTLMLAGAFVSLVCAAVLATSWWQTGRTRAGLWWAGGHLAQGLGVLLLAVGFATSQAPLFMFGLLFIVLAPALVWSGLLAFRKQPVRPLLTAAGPVAWLLGAPVIAALDAFWAMPVVNSLMGFAYQSAAIWQLVRLGDEGLRARKPLLVFVAVHTCVTMLAIEAALTGGVDGLTPPPIASLFGLIHFETMIYVIGTTFFFLLMKKERSEQHLLTEAQTDVLTGLANRRAFAEMAERVAERCRLQGDPLTVVVFDLDRFKSINDTFGHAFGDTVLRLFAAVARENLRPGDFLSRVGGEEFFAILPGAGLQEGRSTAERVCMAFAEAGAAVEGCDVKATVSAGVMAGEDGTTALGVLLEKADVALYRAKLNGRNRVEVGVDKDAPDEKPYPRLVRVA